MLCFWRDMRWSRRDRILELESYANSPSRATVLRGTGALDAQLLPSGLWLCLRAAQAGIRLLGLSR
jgi:hypothetical protein